MQDNEDSSFDEASAVWSYDVSDAADGATAGATASVTVTAALRAERPRQDLGGELLRYQLLELLPLLKARAFKLCRDASESEDLVQETLLRALRFEAQFTAGTNLRAWLCTVLGNVFISRCRKHKREARALGGLHHEAALHVWRAPDPERACLGPGVERALGELPAPFEQVVRLVDLEDHAYGDVARRLGIPVGTVMSRLFRARRLLALGLAEGANAAG